MPRSSAPDMQRLSEALMQLVELGKIIEESARGYRHYLLAKGWPEEHATDIAAELVITTLRKIGQSE